MPAYDALGRISGMSYNGQNAYRYYYGTDGQVGLEEDIQKNLSTRYEYDGGGRLTALTTSENERHRYV